MTEWWSYRLSDFLLFSQRAYWRLFELHNETLWPLPIVTLAAGAAILALAIARPRHGRIICILLAILWAWVAWSFLWQRYATINWAAAYVAPVFGLEALLLVLLGGLGNRFSFDQRGPRRAAGLLLITLALVGYPLLAPLLGRPLHAAEIFGIAPDPMAVATLGMLVLARGRLAAILFPIPVLWCCASAATLRAMGDPQAWAPLVAVLLSIAACLPITRNRTADSRRDHPSRIS